MTIAHGHAPAPCVHCGRTDYTAKRRTQKFCSRACWNAYDSIHQVRRESSLRHAAKKFGVDLNRETSGECRVFARQQGGACEFNGCRHHNGSTATDATRCALIVASNEGGLGQLEVAKILGVTKQRVSWIELSALEKLRATRGSGRLRVFA